MPKSLGGLIGFIAMSVITVVVGLYVFNRIPFLQTVVSKKAA